MSTTVSQPSQPAQTGEPWLVLPGFMPDALNYAVRTTAALLLAYFTAFAIQLDTASSAGLCVAIVSQPTPGMTMSKAVYRIIGTLLGGVVAFALVSIFPQNRTMLLLSFSLWLGGCTFVASLLRDFRAYGAALCGYTVGIIAVAEIDTPDNALLATLNRVAAILIGIAAVALVNALLSPAVAAGGLIASLRERLAEADALALSVLKGGRMPDEPLPAQAGAMILALRTDATYAAGELPDGRRRSDGARAAIAGLLGMLSATKALDTGLRQAPDEATRHALDVIAAKLRDPDGANADWTAVPRNPHSAALLDRARELVARRLLVVHGLRTLVEGVGLPERVRLPLYYDFVGAGLNGARTVISVCLGSVFCIYAGWPGATILLVQQAAFTALLGMTPDPSAAAKAMALSAPVPLVAAYVVGYLLLPQVSGFVPFALAIAPFAFLGALAVRHPATARFGPGYLLYFTLVLSPSNTESFDLATFLNNVMIQLIAILFMILAFRFVLPVSRQRRLFRVADSIGRNLQAALAARAAHLDPIAARCLRVDRLAQAQVWLGQRTPARIAVLQRLSAFSELESALRRAQAGLRWLGRPMPPREPAALEALARDLLADEHTGEARHWAVHAASGLHGSALLLRGQGRALRRYGIVEA